MRRCFADVCGVVVSVFAESGTRTVLGANGGRCQEETREEGFVVTNCSSHGQGVHVHAQGHRICTQGGSWVALQAWQFAHARCPGVTEQGCRYIRGAHGSGLTAAA